MTQDQNQRGPAQPAASGGAPAGSPSFSRPPLGGPFVVLRHWGEIDPEQIDTYLAKGGYNALKRATKEMTPAEVIETVGKAKLRGRGGAGYPVAKKWEKVAAATGQNKFVICNAFGADPAAAGDRALLERNPQALIEGLAIAAYAVGATQGYIYCRGNLPEAINRMKRAVAQAEAKGLIGFGALNGQDFTVSVVSAPVAFINGEETALLTAIEGDRAMPKQRPPYPVESGLWNQPTAINNAETLANLPAIIADGAAKFASQGSSLSGGTKLLTIQGRVNKTGLAEIPFGTALGQIVDGIGGGPKAGATTKAVQVGGPLGGCLTAEMLVTPLDYEDLAAVDCTIGSGSVLVLDQNTCMVDFARFRLNYIQNEACGRCIPGRMGTNRINGILEALVSGLGKKGDIEILEELAEGIARSSLCGLCTLAVQPLITTLRHFRAEFLAHLEEKRCPTGRCTPVRTVAFRKNKVLL